GRLLGRHGAQAPQWHVRLVTERGVPDPVGQDLRRHRHSATPPRTRLYEGGVRQEEGLGLRQGSEHPAEPRWHHELTPTPEQRDRAYQPTVTGGRYPLSNSYNSRQRHTRARPPPSTP